MAGTGGAVTRLGVVQPFGGGALRFSDAQQVLEQQVLG